MCDALISPFTKAFPSSDYFFLEKELSTKGNSTFTQSAKQDLWNIWNVPSLIDEAALVVLVLESGLPGCQSQHLLNLTKF